MPPSWTPAREITSKAETSRSQTDRIILEKSAEIREKYHSLMQQETAALRETAQQEAKRQLAEDQALQAQRLEALETRFAEGKEGWIQSIYQLVINAQ